MTRKFLFQVVNSAYTPDGQRRADYDNQYGEMLVKVGDTLKENGVANVFIKGNVFVRTRAIDAFKLYREQKQAKSTRVIKLSLENAASGTNLIEGTHVILLDPVAGTRAKAVAVETQAIGRVHRIRQKKQVTVVRMIVRDTIEQTMYVRNQQTNIQQVELDIGATSLTEHGVEIVRSIRKFDLAPLVEAEATAAAAVMSTSKKTTVRAKPSTARRSSVTQAAGSTSSATTSSSSTAPAIPDYFNLYDENIYDSSYDYDSSESDMDNDDNYQFY